MRYELTDDEWAAIRPMLPNKPRGVPRVNDRRSAQFVARSNMPLDSAFTYGLSSRRKVAF